MTSAAKKIPSYRVTLKEREPVAETAHRVRFQFEDGVTLSHEPGQYVWLILDSLTTPDARGTRRAFSVISPNTETTYVDLLVRDSDSGYKQTLLALPLGGAATIIGPFGRTFASLATNTAPVTFIIGGVAIAPFLSYVNSLIVRPAYRLRLVHYVASQQRACSLDLLAPGLKEKRIDVIDHEGEFTPDALPKDTDFVTGEFYVLGPQGFVNAVHSYLNSQKVAGGRQHYEENYPEPTGNLTEEVFKGERLQHSIFARAINDSKSHTIITDANGRILYANKVAERNTGFTFDEMRGNTPRLWGGLMPTKFYESFWKSKQSPGGFDGELTNHSKNGDIYIVIAHISPITSEDGRVIGYIGTEEDITLTKTQQEQLEVQNTDLSRGATAMMNILEDLDAEKKKLTALVETLPVGVSLAEAPSGKLVFVNKIATEILGRGIDPNATIDNYDKIFDVVKADGSAYPPAEMTPSLVLKTGKSATKDDVYIKKPDGSVVQLRVVSVPIADTHGETTSILSIFQDITAERASVREIAEGKARAEGILSSVAEGVIVIDGMGKFIFFNEEAKRMLGRGPEDIRPDEWPKTYNMYELEADTLVDIQNMQIMRAMQGERVVGDKVRIKQADGSFIVVRINASPVSTGERMVGVVFSFIDVSKETEIDKAKTEFVSLASHQLRTPLSAINWYAEMLIAGDAGPLTEDQKNYIQEIYTGNQRMVDLVNALLNVSRIDLGTFIIEPKPTNLKEMLTSVVAEQKQMLTDKHLTVNVSIAPDLPAVSVDPKLMRMILQNLLSNAAKYTPEKGSIDLALSIQKKGAAFGGLALEADMLCFSVKDTGYGIPEAQQKNIFTKLFRADNAREKDTTGTGLGLYIIRSILDHAGGAVWFDSVENNGTTFYVTLPASGMLVREGSRELG